MCFFLSLQAGLDLLSVGHMLADVVAIIGKFPHQQNAVSVGRRALVSLSQAFTWQMKEC